MIMYFYLSQATVKENYSSIKKLFYFSLEFNINYKLFGKSKIMKIQYITSLVIENILNP